MHVNGCGQSCLVKGFQYSKEYASKFEPLKDFFAENETMDLKALEGKDHGRLHPLLHLPNFTPSFGGPVTQFADVAFFRRSLYRYRRQHLQAMNCPTEKDLGLLLVDTKELKAELIPSPVRCLDVSMLNG